VAAVPPTTDFRGRSHARPRLTAFRDFLQTEAGGAVVLLFATLAALIWANSPWRDSYTALWATHAVVGIGELTLDLSLGHWVNDGVMALFFLLVGLEIRREFDLGEFRERRRLAVPVIAAFGGMALPVVIFLALNAGTDGARGWAMVMGTDTAFAVGVLALVGRRSSVRLRIFLLTLVIIDDVAAISVIAIFYSTNLQLTALGAGIGLLVVMGVLRGRGVERPVVYALLALAIWYAALQAGVHPTVAGVAIGLLTGAHPPRRSTLEGATAAARDFRQQPTPDLATVAARRIRMSISPNDRLQHTLHPWSSFVVVPLFALANAGIDLSGNLLERAFASPVTLGVILGLVVGKTLGIPIGAWIGTRGWLGGLPLSVSWPSLVAASSVGGIGFTVSLLIADLSFDGATLEAAKLGVLGASLLAAILTVVMFHLLGMLPRDWLSRFEAHAAPPLHDLAVPVNGVHDHIRGALEAPVTLVEYGDFECPHCLRAYPILKELQAKYGDQLRVVFRNLPLPDVHPDAALAAEAVEAAGAQGKFWEMHDTLYEHAGALQLPSLLRYAGEIGLDVPTFEADLRSGRYARRVERDVATAEASGVAGTPAFFINRIRYRGAYDLASLSVAIDRALAAFNGRESLVRSGDSPA
jgi:Na+/H+ antiporter NhaA